MQAEPGDLAFFLRKEAIEISYERNSYLIVHHGAILALVRPKAENIIDDIEDMLDKND